MNGGSDKAGKKGKSERVKGYINVCSPVTMNASESTPKNKNAIYILHSSYVSYDLKAGLGSLDLNMRSCS